VFMKARSKQRNMWINARVSGQKAFGARSGGERETKVNLASESKVNLASEIMAPGQSVGGPTRLISVDRRKGAAGVGKQRARASTFFFADPSRKNKTRGGVRDMARKRHIHAYQIPAACGVKVVTNQAERPDAFETCFSYLVANGRQDITAVFWLAVRSFLHGR